MSRFRASLVVVLLLLSSVAEAAIARRGVVEGHTSGAGTTTCTSGNFASNPVTGDTLVAAVSTFGLGITVSAPTDTGSNTYTQIGTTLNTANNVKLTLWYKSNATGGATFNVVGHTSGNGCTVVAWALSGAATASYNSDTTGTTGNSANPASGTSTPAPAASSFFLGEETKEGTETTTAGTNWQFETNSTQTDNTTFQALYTEDLTAATSSSAQSATYTQTTDQWGARVASFAPAAGGAPATKRLLTLGVGDN